jgi:hypothetical protein
MWKIPNSYFYGKDKINNIGEKKIHFSMIIEFHRK